MRKALLITIGALAAILVVMAFTSCVAAEDEPSNAAHGQSTYVLSQRQTGSIFSAPSHSLELRFTELRFTQDQGFISGEEDGESQGVEEVKEKVAPTPEKKDVDTSDDPSTIDSEEPEQEDTTETKADGPTLIEEIPSTHAINEDATVERLIDLSAFFADDDSESARDLTYTMTAEPDNGILFINGYMLGAEASNAPNWYGDITVVIRAENHDHLWVDSNTFTVTVREVNDPPTAVQVPLSPFYQGSYTYVNLDERFNDVDDEELAFTVSGEGNIVVTLDGASARLYAPTDWFGVEEITFTASDGKALVSQDIGVVVNQAPSIMPYGQEPMPVTEREALVIDIGEMVPASTEILEVVPTAGSTNLRITVDPETKVVTIEPLNGWTGKTTLTLHVSTSGGPMNVQIPIMVKEATRPIMAWLTHYLLGTIMAGVVVGSRFYARGRGYSSMPSPVKLESYSYYKYR